MVVERLFSFVIFFFFFSFRKEARQNWGCLFSFFLLFLHLDMGYNMQEMRDRFLQRGSHYMGEITPLHYSNTQRIKRNSEMGH